MDIFAIEALIESFATSALGLTLAARVHDFKSLPTIDRRCREPIAGYLLPAWCAWQTDRGLLVVLAQYDEPQSALVRANVLLFEWWIGPNEHHVGWYHCFPKFPRGWVVGPGRVNRY